MRAMQLGSRLPRRAFLARRMLLGRVCGLSTIEVHGAETAAANPDSAIAAVPLAQATKADVGKFFELSEDTQERLVPEGIGRRASTTFDLVKQRHIMLRDRTQKMLAHMQNWETLKHKTHGAFVIDGDRGCGKSLALLQLVQYARESGWLVLYIPQARSWCHEAPYVVPSPYTAGKFDIDEYGVTLLQQFLHCHGEQLRTIPLRGSYEQRYYPESLPSKPKNFADVDLTKLTLRDLVVNGIRDEDLACAAVIDLRAELGQVTEYPVLIAIDEYNTWFADTVFGFDGVPVAPSQISVIDALSDVREHGLLQERRLKNGMFIAATTENFPSKYKFKQQVDYKALRRTMLPYQPHEMTAVMAYYNQVTFLHDKPTDEEFAFFRLMTKSVPLQVFDRASFT